MKNLQRGGAFDFQIAEAQGKRILAAKKSWYALLVEKTPLSANNMRPQISISLFSRICMGS
jgi:hypothetical protein